MDQKLVAWARAVKARRRNAGPPPLWFFTDEKRTADTISAVRRLPKGLCGVVFRHDAAPGRPDLAKALARICRERRLSMVTAGRTVSLPAVGRHVRAGRGEVSHWSTSSAHCRADIVRGRRAAAVFVSPVFPTASHPGQPALGLLRWAIMARGLGRRAFALGGIDGVSVRRLPRWIGGAGAVGALLDTPVLPVRHSVSRLP